MPAFDEAPKDKTQHYQVCTRTLAFAEDVVRSEVRTAPVVSMIFPESKPPKHIVYICVYI